jgi:hypothetical protein
VGQEYGTLVCSRSRARAVPPSLVAGMEKMFPGPSATGWTIEIRRGETIRLGNSRALTA